MRTLTTAEIILKYLWGQTTGNKLTKGQVDKVLQETELQMEGNGSRNQQLTANDKYEKYIQDID